MLQTTLLICTLVAVVANAALLLMLLRRRQEPVQLHLEPQFANLANANERLERGLREEVARNREEGANTSRQLREEVVQAVKGLGELLLSRVTEGIGLQRQQLESFAAQLNALTQSNEKRLDLMREGMERKLAGLQSDAAQNHARGREEMLGGLKAFGELFLGRMTEIATLQKGQLESFAANLNGLTQATEQRLDKVRETVESRLVALQTGNDQKLEQMRATVDEKLHATLEQRLGESFKIVSERLEQVHKGLGEMQVLASGVGDLKRVLTNIKTRGCWGEVQLGSLLEQMLTPDQYAVNVAPNPAANERVEFAVKLPGRDGNGKPVWLPIDAKFPHEDYQRLVDAQERADPDAAAAAAAALEARVWGEAKKIREKYVCPPHSTDFAIMFLPMEGLFAEVLRRPGLCDGVMTSHRVLLTGPTTLSAVLTSLRMGFQTLAIEKRSSEVWTVLGAVKTEFSKFGDVLEKVEKKLQEASNVVNSATTRSRAIERKLRGVEELPTVEAARIMNNIEVLGLVNVDPDQDASAVGPIN